jgi:hypothetical protein
MMAVNLVCVFICSFLCLRLWFIEFDGLDLGLEAQI